MNINILLILLFIIIAIVLNYYDAYTDKETFTNYLPLQDITHTNGEPSDKIKKVLNSDELNMRDYLNKKELFHRRNYNIMTAEDYYEMLFNYPVQPMKSELDDKKYQNTDNNKILNPDLIKHRPLSSHIWYITHDIDPENINKMHLPPQYYIPYK